MKMPAAPQLSLLWKILLSTALIITLVLAAAMWFVEDEAVDTMQRDLQGEMQAGFRAYESLWKARADNLRSISTVLSTMSDVRAAFATNDRATIRDTAAEIWSKVSQSDAFFLVTEPGGRVIASLGGHSISADDLAIVRAAARRFPAQSEGFSVQEGNLYEVVITPVYVQTSESTTGLLNVLVAGFLVDQNIAAELRQRTGGSDFFFRVPGVPLISTAGQSVPEPGGDYAVIASKLADIDGQPIGELLMVRSYERVRNSIRMLQRRFIWIWGTAITAAALMSFLIARRILRPIQELDRAALRIAEQDYSVHVPESGGDEVGRLARTFNQMSASIQDARDELIRHERLNTIGRLAGSIIHDLRNPLAAIYGGAEMLVDGELNEQQTERVARNIYRSSRAIKDLLQELAEVSRGQTHAAEVCSLREIVLGAATAQEAFAELHGVQITVDIEPVLEVSVERGRMERVFVNLLNNAVEAMPEGGKISMSAERDKHKVIVRVADTGPGIPEHIRSRLFQPFVNAGKNGLGLGLALSRQTVRAHGGELWVVDREGPGACFCVKLPLVANEMPERVIPSETSAESIHSNEAPRLT